MKALIIAMVSFGLLMGTSNAVGRPYEAKSFYNPVYKGYRLDWCLEWGKKCGLPPAQVWCQRRGYDRATNWKIKTDIGSNSPTKVMTGGRVCDQSHCDGFAWIVCERFGDKYKSGKACLDIGNRTGAAAPTCEGHQGHNYGKAGRSFKKGEKVWILLRLKNLPAGNHVLTTAKNRTYRGKTTGSAAWAQRKEFSNTQNKWWLWFESKARDSGEWIEHISIDGERLGYVEYCVDCTSWD
jgi:hypothetical protein